MRLPQDAIGFHKRKSFDCFSARKSAAGPTSPRISLVNPVLAADLRYRRASAEYARAYLRSAELTAVSSDIVIDVVAPAGLHRRFC